MKISDKEIASILAEVEAEIAPLLRSERERLSKAAEDSVGSASPMGEESRSPGRDLMPDERSGSSASPEASASSASPMPEGSASASAGSPAPEASESAGAPEGEEAGGDVEALAAQYAELPPEQLEMHLMAIEAAMQKMGAAGGGAPEGMAPPAQAGAMPPPEQSAGMPAMKSEKSVSASAEKSPKMPVKKEESSMEASKSPVKKEESSKAEHSISKSEFEAVEAKLDMALKAVEFLTRPMRKAVTEFAVAETKAPTSLTKGEVTAKLKEVTSSPKLQKSDRQLINGFYDGRVSLDQIAHLLK
jgi:hypothetical protein